MTAISVVIPTYNPRRPLADLLSKCMEFAGGIELEFVVVNDGSTNDAAEQLEKCAEKFGNLVWTSIENRGAGGARNVGADMARHDILLFLGDDITPINADFFRAHAEIHEKMPGDEIAVLGKAIWPATRDFDVSFVMSHIQGGGGEQFGYAHIPPYTELDWRFFYTINISVKKSVAKSWVKDGFSDSFQTYGYEDIEFAYRLFNRRQGLKIIYAPLSVGTHDHQYDVAGFLRRQVNAGNAAREFVRIHPNVATMVAPESVPRALRKPILAEEDRHIPDQLLLIEGLKAWIRMLEGRGKLGSEHWHAAALSAMFRLAYAQGYILGETDPEANLGAAYDVALARFRDDINRTAYIEFTGTMFSPDQLYPGGQGRNGSGHGRLMSSLRLWAIRRPWAVALYRMVRRAVRG
jgi:glycosyltransferase involved in cell wall biosynthesis